MTNQVSVVSEDAMTTLILKGDIGLFSDEQKVEYYKAMCNRTGLDWTTKPFDYLTMQGKKVLYLNKSGVEQLNALHNVSITITHNEQIGDVYVVTVRASNEKRFTDSTGAVPVKGLAGDGLANAYMKAETKAKRRATLSLLGLAILDESEAQHIPGGVLETAEVFLTPLATPEDLKELCHYAKGFGWSGEEVRDLCLQQPGMTKENLQNFLSSFSLSMLRAVQTHIAKHAKESAIA